MRSCHVISFTLLAGVLAGCARTAAVPETPPPSTLATLEALEALAIPVTAAENRAVSFTNKVDAYLYTQTHRNDHPEHAWFRGLNVAGRRVFNDWRLVLDGRELDPATATRVVVRPDALVREYRGDVTETVRLLDDRTLVSVQVAGDGGRATLRLTGDRLEPVEHGAGIDHYRSRGEGADASADEVAVGRAQDRLLVAVAPTRTAADSLLAAARRFAPAWESARHARLRALVTGDRVVATSDTTLTRALAWLTLTTDALVTRQRGDGIYAGLPWFNEYWGRDEFISLPGALLVTGHFEEARAVLASFAQFQDTVRASPFYGRMPNIVKPGSLDYHTTDGTPRWVLALGDYVRYSGDTAIVRQLWPNIAASIEGALAHFTDSSGYLTHADNETWMDARREPDKVAYVPRATRANDIQALWVGQLETGAELAAMAGDAAAASRWRAHAARVRAAFARDFVDARAARVADHLDARGIPDWTLRPNLLFALDLVDDATAVRATRQAWERLVYPWGVATLDARDPFFHPYHVAPGRWHKDEAYHNGTVWPWLNGIAMQRLLAAGQPAPAWRLFAAMNDLALHRGAVGGLPETMDAWPHPGERAPNLTGTFLQAWSNAEQLRAWYQGFLGVHPDLLRGEVVLAPRLPDEVASVETSARVGDGWLRVRADRVHGARRWRWSVESAHVAHLVVDLPPWERATIPVARGDELEMVLRGDGLALRVTNGATVKQAITVRRDPARVARQASLDALFRGVDFAKPGNAYTLPVMRGRR